MREMLKADCLSEEKQVKNEAMKAAEVDEILQKMTEICSGSFELLDIEKPSFVGCGATPYYIYSDIVAWVLNRLETDELQ
jgi:hypothetical protein